MAKELILREIGLSFDRHRVLLAEFARMQAEVSALESTLPSTTSSETCSVVSSLATPYRCDVDGAVAGADGGHLGAGGAKRPRQRSARSSSGTTRKKAAAGPAASSRASVKGSDSSDPKRQEEIERQIQDIVQKALSVDQRRQIGREGAQGEVGGTQANEQGDERRVHIFRSVRRRSDQ